MRKFSTRVNWQSALFVCFGCVPLLLMTPANTVRGQHIDHSKDLPYAKDPTNLSKALDNLKAGHYRANDVELVARMRASQAIPDLEALFPKTQDPEDKQKIANGLVRLGVADDTYWNFLSTRYSVAMDRGAPDPLRYDSHGQVVPDKPSEAFVAWASQNKLDVKAALFQVVFEDVGAVHAVATSQDERAIPLLRRAFSLQSFSMQNCLMQSAAARGLADLHDEGSIPLIIGASARASKDCAATIAKALVYFDDSDAQHAVDLYVPQEAAKIAREHRAHGYGPFD
jgi:hypothetical protein